MKFARGCLPLRVQSAAVITDWPVVTAYMLSTSLECMGLRGAAAGTATSAGEHSLRLLNRLHLVLVSMHALENSLQHQWL